MEKAWGGAVPEAKVLIYFLRVPFVSASSSWQGLSAWPHPAARIRTLLNAEQTVTGGSPSPQSILAFIS